MTGVQGFRYHCKDGFVMSGVAYQTCGYDRKWTGEPPLCTPTKFKTHPSRAQHALVDLTPQKRDVTAQLIILLLCKHSFLCREVVCWCRHRRHLCFPLPPSSRLVARDFRQETPRVSGLKTFVSRFNNPSHPLTAMLLKSKKSLVN